MKINLLAAGIAMLIAAMPAQAIIDAPVPNENYITHDYLDWAWASPCAAYKSSCSGIDLSYQATEGWRYPTLTEFINRPTAAAFGGACASAWFDINYSHCDAGDPDAGYLFDYGFGETPYGAEDGSDSWVVRGENFEAVPEDPDFEVMPSGPEDWPASWTIRGDNPGAVPEAATWMMLVMGFGLVGGAARRRTAVAA